MSDWAPEEALSPAGPASRPGAEPLSSPLATISVGAAVHIARPDGTGVDVTGKAAVMLSMLALEGRAMRRQLAMTLWPDSPESQARNNLRTLVHRLNQRVGTECLVGGEYLEFDRHVVQVAPPDADALLVALSQDGAQGCELLSNVGVTADASDALMEWLDASRSRMRRAQLGTLCDAHAGAMSRADHQSAIAFARACVQLEPLSERWHRQLMETFAQCGDRAAALAAYEDCATQLRDQLGVLPDPQTRALQLRLLHEQANERPEAARPAGFGPSTGPARYPMVEREVPLAQAQSALNRGLHVCIQGEAGVGKTRLLRHLALQAETERLVIRPEVLGEPYAAIAQLLQRVQPRKMARVGLSEQIELARLAPTAFPEVESSRASFSAWRLHAALREWVTSLGRAGVQCLMLDDLHHADALSQEAIAALIEADLEGAPTPPSLVLSYRSGDVGPALERAVVAARVRGRVCCITLPRLTPAGVSALLDAVAGERGAAASEALAAQLFERTGGNPLFVIELAQHALDQPAARLGASKSTLDMLLRSQLSACSESAQQLAFVAAVAASDFSVELASVVIGQTPLALMPAWNELQQRGLFAEVGLAHDLVRETALAMLPAAIRRALHEGVAGYLESLGSKSASVLAHWMAAQNSERALPHAVQQLRANNAVGLDAAGLQGTVLALLEQVSDGTLAANLWLTVEISGESMPVDGWQHMATLVRRAASLQSTASTAGWLAFETSRLAYFRDNAIKPAYETLRTAIDNLPACGPERAWAELAMLTCSFVLDGTPRDHLQHARRAVTDLADDHQHRSLHRQLLVANAIFADPAPALMALANAMRSARHRGDRAAADEARVQIASIQAKLGNYTRAHRHLQQLALESKGSAPVPDERLVEVGFAAMNAGRFAQALQCFELAGNRFFAYRRTIFLAIVLRRLGQWQRAQAALDTADSAFVGRQFNTLVPAAIVRAELDVHAGRDPLIALRQTVASMKAMGMGDVMLELMQWEILRRTAKPEQRIVTGTALVESLKAESRIRSSWLRTVIELAESHAQAGSPGFRALALEAGHALRRGYGSHTLYIPDALVRCAQLLQTSDPAEAARLTEHARRWVQQALAHVPAFARMSFVNDVPVNRRLLGEGAVDKPTGDRR